MFGTTYSGGSIENYGTIFKIATNGVLTTLFAFAGVNGSKPQAGIIKGGDGMYYGTTSSGGTGNNGTVFRLTPAGQLTVIGNFSTTTNGINPYSSLVQGNDGAFYGTTYVGGNWNNSGAVYRITTNGFFTSLASFAGTNGRRTSAGVVQASDQFFYGVTPVFGSKGGGNIYRFNLANQITSLNKIANGWQVVFSGLPSQSYQLLRSTNVAESWVALTNITFGNANFISFKDTNAPISGAFYKTVSP